MPGYGGGHHQKCQMLQRSFAKSCLNEMGSGKQPLGIVICIASILKQALPSGTAMAQEALRDPQGLERRRHSPKTPCCLLWEEARTSVRGGLL